MYNEKYKIEEEERIWRCVIGKGMKKNQKYKIEEQEKIKTDGEMLPGWQSNEARKGLTAARRNDCT